MIEVILNGKKVESEAGITILELAKRNVIEIPTLCMMMNYILMVLAGSV